MAIVELDYMEYASDGAAQTAYVTDAGALLIEQASAPNVGILGDIGDIEKRLAQSFTLSSSATITKLSLKFGASNGSPSGDVTFRIETNVSSLPSGSLAHASATKVITVTASQWNDAEFASSFPLSAGTYWIVMVCDNQGTNVSWQPNQDEGDPYADGITAQSNDGGSSWIPLSDRDLTFRVYSTEALQSYSEDTIIQQGTYSLKVVATQTDSLNDTLTKSGLSIDLSGKEEIKYDIYSASRTGSHIKIGIHDSGGTTTEHTANILATGGWETQTIDLSGVADENKDDIDSIIITIVNADAANTFYVDNMYAQDVALDNSIFFGAAF